LVKANNVRNINKNSELTIFLSFIIIFFILQSLYSYGYTVSLTVRSSLAIELIARFTVWTFPVLIYLLLLRKNPFDYLKVNKDVIKGLVWGIVVSLILVLVNVIGHFLANGYVRFNLNFSCDLWWKAVILVGFSEEVLFRGFILQKFSESIKFWQANIINSILFTLIHFPGWIFLNQFIMPHIIQPIAFIFIFAFIQGFIFKKSNSLWACIIIHSVNNFLSFALI